MKVLYDHQIFIIQNYGGISRYFFELVKEIDKIENIKTSTSLLLSNNYYISQSPKYKHINFFKNHSFKGKQIVLIKVNTLNSVRVLKKTDFDVFHPTYYSPYFLSNLGNKPFVVTVYDMIHAKFTDLFPNDQTPGHIKALTERADKIIAISESTKRDLIELFGTDESKIEVVYLGNSMVVNDDLITDIVLPPKYILYVGSRKFYKNFEGFIRCSVRLLEEDKDLSIMCIGGDKFTSSELELLAKLGIANKVKHSDLTDELLAHFYKNAVLFVFPSLYEGFGIPILESFACGCPLVCSNTSSFPEVAGDGAEYFSPDSEISMYTAIKKVLNSNERREELVKKGYERLKEFSWSKTAAETVRIYKSVMK